MIPTQIPWRKNLLTQMSLKAGVGRASGRHVRRIHLSHTAWSKQCYQRKAIAGQDRPSEWATSKTWLKKNASGTELDGKSNLQWLTETHFWPKHQNSLFSEIETVMLPKQLFGRNVFWPKYSVKPSNILAKLVGRSSNATMSIRWPSRQRTHHRVQHSVDIFGN